MLPIVGLLSTYLLILLVNLLTLNQFNLKLTRVILWGERELLINFADQEESLCRDI